MIKLISEDLDIEKIALSGQCFRFVRIAEKDGCPGSNEVYPKGSREEDPETFGIWETTAFGRVLRVKALPDGAELCCSEEEYRSVWKDYFDMNYDYAAVRRSIDPDDRFLTKAAEIGRGIRILRQDPWEALISFIISQRKNIPAIKACVEAVCAGFASRISDDRYAFPTPAQLASASEEDLKLCSLGYRVPYVLSAARAVDDGSLDLEKLSKLSDEELMDELLALHGVGIKVASCSMLFGFHRIGAFPIDVWIDRVLKNEYPDGFPFARYEGYAGILQQYMFYNAIKK